MMKLQGDFPIFFEHQLDPDANQIAAFPASDREAFTAHWPKILSDETIIKKTILFHGQVAGNVEERKSADTRRGPY